MRRNFFILFVSQLWQEQLKERGLVELQLVYVMVSRPFNCSTEDYQCSLWVRDLRGAVAGGGFQPKL